MRRHVEGMPGGGRDLRVDAGRAHAERRVDGIVVGVDQVVNRARVERILREDFLGDRGGLHVGRNVALALAGPQNREGVEGRRVLILGKPLVEAAHRLRVVPVVGRLVPLAVKNLDGGQVHPLPLGRRLRQARFRRRGEPFQGLASRAGVLLHPERMVEGHRLAPVSHGEAGLRLLRGAEFLGRVVELEAVEQQSAAQEVALRLRGARRRKVDPAQLVRPGRGRSGRERPEERREGQSSSPFSCHRRLLHEAVTRAAPEPRTGTSGGDSSSRTPRQRRRGTAGPSPPCRRGGPRRRSPCVSSPR